MNPIIANYIETFKKYVLTTGRASRSEIIIFYTINFIIFAALFAIDKKLGTTFHLHKPFVEVGCLSILFVTAAILPTTCVSIRRLHDLDRGGYTIIIIVVTLFKTFTSSSTTMRLCFLAVSTIYLTYIIAIRGTRDSNRFGQPVICSVDNKALRIMLVVSITFLLTWTIINFYRPIYAVAYLIRGDYQYKKGNVSKALHLYDSSIEQSPTAYAYHARAVTLFQLHDFNSAAHDFLYAVLTQESSHSQSDYKNYVSDFSKLIEANPQNLMAYSGLCMVHMLNNELDSALEVSNKGIIETANINAEEKLEDLTFISICKAKTYEFKKDYDLSLTNINEAIRLSSRILNLNPAEGKLQNGDAAFVLNLYSYRAKLHKILGNDAAAEEDLNFVKNNSR